MKCEEAERLAAAWHLLQHSRVIFQAEQSSGCKPDMILCSASMNIPPIPGYLFALGPLLFVSICDVWLDLFSQWQAYAINLIAVGVVAFGCTGIDGHGHTEGMGKLGTWASCFIYWEADSTPKGMDGTQLSALQG